MMPNLKVSRLICLLAIPIIVGCAAYQNQYSTTSSPNLAEIAAQRRQAYVNSHRLTQEQKQAILNGSLYFGMTGEQVIAVWGNPTETKRAGNAEVIQEVWIYYPPYVPPSQEVRGVLTLEMQQQLYNIYLANRKGTYLYFENGIYKSFEEK